MWAKRSRTTKKKKNVTQLCNSFTDVLNETMVNDKASCDHDGEPSSSRELIEHTNRSENFSEISGGALNVDLSGSLSFHSSSESFGSSASGPKTWSCLQGGGVSYTHTEDGSSTLPTITGASHMQESEVSKF